MRGTAVILAVLLLLLFSPVRLRFTLYEQAAALEVRFLLLRFRFPSEKPKKQEPEKKKARREKAKNKKAARRSEKKKKGEKKQGLLSGPWNAERLCAAAELLREALAMLGRAGAFFLRGIRIKKLWLEIMVVRGDACATGIESGRLNAWACGMLALLQNFIRPKDVYLNIYPGFWAAKQAVSLEAACSVTPARALGAGCILIGRGIRLLVRYLCLSRSDGLSPGSGPAAADAAPNTQQEGS